MGRRQERRAANPEADRQASRRYREAHPERAQESIERYREANRGKLREARRQQYQRLREAVFDHYGRSCTCCGSTEQPTIDHVNGDGAKHRAELGLDGDGTYRWLIKNGFPEGFQTLCDSCNKSKGNGSSCRINHSAAA